ncbi:hypothetical protein EP837_02927 [Sphingobium sp. EP60837]|nr:hypothetical protein EP837_02927 [Sphingobium sp. EP60837]
MIDEKTREDLNKRLPVFSVPQDEAEHFYTWPIVWGAGGHEALRRCAVPRGGGA